MDVERCPKWDGTLKLVAMITETAALTRLLTHLGLPTTPPRVEPARLAPQTAWDFGDDVESTAPTFAPPSARGPPDVQWRCLPS